MGKKCRLVRDEKITPFLGRLMYCLVRRYPGDGNPLYLCFGIAVQELIAGFVPIHPLPHFLEMRHYVFGFRRFFSFSAE
jgi:hypothetical protein